MRTPIVIEHAVALEPVTRDTFLDEVDHDVSADRLPRDTSWPAAIGVLVAGANR